MINKFTAAVAVLALVVLAGCEQPVAQTTKFTGTATRYFVAHQGGYLGEATVTTDDSGNVTAASMNEWHGPSGWAAYPTGTTAFAGGEIIRFKMAGKTPSTVVVGGTGYAYFFYNKAANVWYEFSLPTTNPTGAYTQPVVTDRSKNWDALMALPLYAKAYADACKAVSENTDATAMQTVTLTDAGANNPPVLTVVEKATSHYGHLNKSATDSTYMPVSTSSIGYKNNTAALIKFFTNNPTASYNSATTTNAAVSITDTTYTAATDSVWTVADVVTGATYSDFISYATELQNAYIAAVAEVKTGNIRAIK